MPTKRHWEVNPFESPINARASSRSTTTSHSRTQEPDILATADLLLEQLNELEILCSTVEERVQRKRKALKELEYLILGPDSPRGSPRSPVCPANTPIGSRPHLVSPRLRGLFDLRGPGQANLDATQCCLDYSPDAQTVVIPTREEFGISEDWVDDDNDALFSDSPFDDKYALRQSPRMFEKKLPPIPQETSEVLESKIPRKVYVRREVSISRVAGRPLGTVARSSSHRRRPTVRNVKTTNAGPDPPTKGSTRRGSYKRSAFENDRAKGGAKGLSTNENESEKDRACRKEKRKGPRSIYSVYSEFGLSGTPRAI